jgi:hypothetical protein
MNPILKNVFAILSGIIVGSMVNMALITISSSIIPPPEGADLTTMEGLKSTMHLFEPKHFLFPFLAHAIGTFAGAIVAALIADKHKMRYALGVGAFFLLGGIANVFMLPSPLWYAIVDLLGAYIPMAYLGGMIALRRTNKIQS